MSSSLSSRAWMVPVDPQDELVQNRVFLAREREDEDAEGVDTVDTLAVNREQLRRYLPLLPVAEQDIIALRARGKTETDLGLIFGQSQANVSYRLGRAKERLRWLRETEPFRLTAEELAAVLTEEVCLEALRRGRRLMPTTRVTAPAGLLLAPLVVSWTSTTCLSEAARRTGRDPKHYALWHLVGQVTSGLEEMAAERPELLRPAQHLKAVRAAPCILWSYGQRTQNAKKSRHS